MAVSTSTLEAKIKAAYDAEKNREDDQQGSIDRIARAIAVAVSDEIVRGVNTAIIALTSPAGAVTGTITASKE